MRKLFFGLALLLPLAVAHAGDDATAKDGGAAQASGPKATKKKERADGGPAEPAGSGKADAKGDKEQGQKKPCEPVRPCPID